MELLIFVLVVISVSQACSPVPQPIYVGRGPDTADVILVTDAVFDPAKINEYMGYWPKTLIEKYGNLLGDLTKHSWTNHNGKFAYTFTIENSDCYKVDSWMKQIVASSPHYVTYVLNCNKPTTTPATTQATNLYINLNGGSGANGNGNGNGLDMSGRQRSPQIVVVREPQPNPNVVIVGNPANQQQLGSRQQSPVVVLGNQQQPQQQSPIVVLGNQQQPQQQSPVVVLRNQQQPQQQSPVVVVGSPQQQQNPPVVVVENRRPPPPKVVYDVDTDVPDDCDD